MKTPADKLLADVYVSAVTGTKAKAADRYAIDVLGIPSLDLMERASRHVTDYILESFGKVTSERNVSVTVMCSVGNNGADGVCIARQLLEENRRFCPRVLIAGSLEKATWEFLRQLSDYRKLGGEVLYPRKDPSEASGFHDLQEFFSSADVIVDALFGIGLKRPVEGIYRDLIEASGCAGGSALKIAVDVPSGINADDGRAMGISFQADVTLTFGRMKTGLLKEDGPAAAGRILVCDIGIPEEAYK